MRELALNILDLIENSIKAEANVIHVAVDADRKSDRLSIIVEDNGFGIDAPGERAADPFYTTGKGKKVGLGLSFLQAAAEQAGGTMRIGRSRLGGARIDAEMRMSHIDRLPIGDIAATISSIVCTNPDIEIVCRLRSNGREYLMRSTDVAREAPVGMRGGLAVARLVMTKLKHAVEDLELGD